MKLEDFVGSYICMEKDIRIEEMQDSVTQYVRLKRKLEETREEIELLEKVGQAYVQYDQTVQDKDLYQYAQNAVEITALKTEISQSIEKSAALQQEVETLTVELSRLEQESAAMQEERDELVGRLRDSGYDTVESSLRHVNETLERCYVGRGAFDKMAKGLQGYITPHLMPGIPKTLVPVIQQVQSYGANKAGLKQIKETIDRVRTDLQEQRDENTADLKKVQNEIKDLRHQIEELENGRKSYPPYLLEAKQRLEEELSIRVSKQVPVEVLADLIEVVDDIDAIAAMAKGGCVAVCLPATSFYLSKPYARAKDMIAAGVPVAAASDFNPGSCPSFNLQFVMNLACWNYGLSPEEVLTAVTLNAAAAIDRADKVGSLEVGKQADILIWDAPNLDYVFYRFGQNLVKTVIKKGQIV